MFCFFPNLTFKSLVKESLWICFGRPILKNIYLLLVLMLNAWLNYRAAFARVFLKPIYLYAAAAIIKWVSILHVPLYIVNSHLCFINGHATRIFRSWVCCLFRLVAWPRGKNLLLEGQTQRNFGFLEPWNENL